MAEKQQYFITLFSQFYLKATKNHSKKITLLKKCNQILSQLPKKFSKNIQLKSQDQLRLNKVSSKNLITTTNLSVQSNGSHSSKGQSQSQKILNNKNNAILFKSRSFSKSVIFAYFHLLINFNEIDTLINLKQDFFNQYKKVFVQVELQLVRYHWQKIIFLSRNKQQNWLQAFSQNFKPFSSQLIDKVFMMITNIDAKSIKLGMINKEMIKNISQSLRIGMNYFCLNKNSMIFKIQQNQQIKKNINIVFIKQKEKFIVVKEPLKKQIQFQAVQKITLTLGQSIKKIMQKYQDDNLFNSSQNTQKSKERQSIERKNMFNFKSQNNILKLNIDSHI